MGCKECNGMCYCHRTHPDRQPCGYCEIHGECVECGEITCSTIVLDGDTLFVCDTCLP
jgi:hypothetical protein